MDGLVSGENSRFCVKSVYCLLMKSGFAAESPRGPVS